MSSSLDVNAVPIRSEGLQPYRKSIFLENNAQIKTPLNYLQYEV